MNNRKFNSLIIGMGNAGEGLHLPCIRKLSTGGQVVAVDPIVRRPQTAAGRGLRIYRRLDDVAGLGRDDTVVHICTAPETHPEVIRQAAAMGFRKILSEKPLATSTAGVEEIRELRAGHDLDILVVANWLHSGLTSRLAKLIATGLFGRPRSATIEQHKPRFARSLSDAGHGTAFDVEMPHQVALALRLFGRAATVAGACSAPMKIRGREMPHRGAAVMALRHRDGVESFLRSDLTALRRERFIRVEFEDGHEALGFYPPDREENFSRLELFDPRGRLVSADTFEDDVLTSVFADCYGYFAGVSGRPASDVDFHAAVASVIDAAKLLSGATSADPGRP